MYCVAKHYDAIIKKVSYPLPASMIKRIEALAGASEQVPEKYQSVYFAASMQY